jgi:hypothetical protein
VTRATGRRSSSRVSRENGSSGAGFGANGMTLPRKLAHVGVFRAVRTVIRMKQRLCSPFKSARVQGVMAVRRRRRGRRPQVFDFYKIYVATQDAAIRCRMASFKSAPDILALSLKTSRPALNHLAETVSAAAIPFGSSSTAIQSVSIPARTGNSLRPLDEISDLARHQSNPFSPDPYSRVLFIINHAAGSLPVFRIGTTGARLSPSIAAAIVAPIVSTARRSGSASRCA